MPKPEETQIEKLTREVDDLKKMLNEHQHLGSDGSKETDGSTSLQAKELNIHGAGAMKGDFSFLPLNIYEGGKEEGQVKRVVSSGILVKNKKGESNEEIHHILFAGKNLTPEQSEKNNNASNQSNFIEVNQAVIDLTHLPQSSLTFLQGYRTPVSGGNGFLVTGENTIIDQSAKYIKNQLVGSYLIISGPSGILETYQIIANTETEITINGVWTVTSAIYTYSIFTPLYLGSATYPFYRGYFIEDIRLGNGASAGSQVIYIKHGTGSPEGVITANIGSLYLDHEGGTNTTLYIKESGNGTATGWVAK